MRWPWAGRGAPLKRRLGEVVTSGVVVALRGPRLARAAIGTLQATPVSECAELGVLWHALLGTPSAGARMERSNGVLERSNDRPAAAARTPPRQCRRSGATTRPTSKPRAL